MSITPLIEWFNKLPIEQISQKAFDGLPEYSCSYPSQTTIGKVWKSKLDYYDESKGWMIGEYIEVGKVDKVGIDWRRVKII